MRRLIAAARARPLAAGVATAAVVGVGAYLVFGVFGFHLIFVDEVVTEEDPFAAGPGASGLPGDAIGEETAEAMNEAMADEEKTTAEVVGEPMPPMDDEPRSLLTGTFVDRSHPTSGEVKVITDGQRRVLRFEGLMTDNGPDLNVYLVAAPPDARPGDLAADFVDLGDLKGNIGDQNYDIPAGVDLERYSTVVIWCVRFSVAFGAAGLG